MVSDSWNEEYDKRHGSPSLNGYQTQRFWAAEKLLRIMYTINTLILLDLYLTKFPMYLMKKVSWQKWVGFTSSI